MRRLMFTSVCVAVAMLTSVPIVGGAQDLGGRDLSYRLGPGDIIEVKAFQYDEISGFFPVEANGTITFPLLGSVEAAGLDISSIADVLEELLEKDFYVDVQLQVEVSEYLSQPVTVLGEIQRPGTYFLKGRTTLPQILAEAGGLKPSAGSTIDVRRSSSGTSDGEDPVPELYGFSTAKLTSGEVGADFHLLVGDVVSVSAKQLFFVTGEVARPGQYEIVEGLTLMQAISQAGGLGKFASQRVELHREGAEAKEILQFDLARIRKGKSDDPEIYSGDVVIIKRRFF